MTTQQSDLFCENRIRPDIRAFLEYHILEELTLREACRRADLPYHKNVSQHKFSKAGRAYVAQLNRRRRVIEEFGVDEPCLATLIEIRDEAFKSGSYVAAGRAHELCIRVAGNSDRKWTGDKKEVDKMTRVEMLAEFSALKLKADGKPLDVDEDVRNAAFRESLGLTKETQSKGEV